MNLEKIEKMSKQCSNNQEVYNTLLALAKLKIGYSNEPFICCDAIEQGMLFKLQDTIMNLLDKIDRETTQKELPFMYR